MPVFQDDLFSPARLVERTLPSGTVLRLKLEPVDPTLGTAALSACVQRVITFTMYQSTRTKIKDGLPESA